MPSETSDPDGPSAACPACGDPVPAGASFCPDCGADLGDPGDPAYCPECGEAFDEETPNDDVAPGESAAETAGASVREATDSTE